MNKYHFEDLQNTVAVVTGGSGGIGLSIVDALLHVGVKVAIINRNSVSAEKALTSINANRSKAFAISADVLDAVSLASAKEQIKNSFGEVDFLINCAGGNSPKATTPAEWITEKNVGNKQETYFGLNVDDMKSVFELNLFGSMLPTAVFSEEMVQRKKGVIINISSVSSFSPLTKIPAYSASKASINNFTQWLAIHFAKTNVRVNAIAPGFFLTAQNRFLLVDEKTGKYSPRAEKIINATPMGRFGETEELQGAVLFLLSDLSKFVTGIVLPVDGGFTAYSGV
ncbi:MAG: SDR family NAD(P)-dependent oxidoreductase [Bacteriovoracaceae bacterium]|nr:SDR family NAD(P)-dependent oxidoreductase [Bacteroidota bacterium]